MQQQQKPANSIKTEQIAAAMARFRVCTEHIQRTHIDARNAEYAEYTRAIEAIEASPSPTKSGDINAVCRTHDAAMAIIQSRYYAASKTLTKTHRAELLAIMTAHDAHDALVASIKTATGERRSVLDARHSTTGVGLRPPVFHACGICTDTQHADCFMQCVKECEKGDDMKYICVDCAARADVPMKCHWCTSIDGLWPQSSDLYAKAIPAATAAREASRLRDIAEQDAQDAAYALQVVHQFEVEEDDDEDEDADENDYENEYDDDDDDDDDDDIVGENWLADQDTTPF
jgi:hypothetical protein